LVRTVSWQLVVHSCDDIDYLNALHTTFIYIYLIFTAIVMNSYQQNSSDLKK